MGQSGLHSLGIVVEKSIHLLRPKNIAGAYIPSPASALGHPLRFSQITLAPAQGLLSALALSDVRRRAHELHQISGCVQNRMANSVDVFDRAVGKKDPEFYIVMGFFKDRSLDCPLPLGSICRMDPLETLFPNRHALCRIEPINPVPFLGQVNCVPSRYLPDPTARMSDPLRFRQVTLASPQRFSRPLAFGDICNRSHELKATVLVL